MRKLICIFLITMPIAALAQKGLFMNEFNGVNNWFFSQANAALVQNYTYYADSAMMHPVDSATITITKNKTAIHYQSTGLELFGDSGYMVKISHTGKYMIVSKMAKTDTEQLKAIFSQVFSGFAKFKETAAAVGSSEWELSGGSAGIKSARIVLDLKNHRIKSLEILMAGSNPLVRPFKKAGQTADPTVIIKVDYQYLPGAEYLNARTLSDFITINGANVTAATKYKGYSIKLIPGKQ